MARIPRTTTVTVAMRLLLCCSLLLLSCLHTVDATAVFVPGHRRRLPNTASILTSLEVRGGASDAMEGLKSSLASAMAAGCSKTLLAPFDTLKTVQQHYRQSSGTALSFWQAVQLVMARPKGFLEFYAGLGVAVVGSMPSVGLYFGVYSYCKRVLIPFFDTNFGPESKYQLPSRLVFSIAITSSAGIGNTIASFSRVPYEVVKQNLQTGLYPSTWVALSTMAKEGGMRAFFPLGGVAIQMVRDIPYAMVTLLSYEMLRESVAPLKERYPEGLVDAMTGALAGGLGSYVTNPLDVIKTRMQTDPALYAGSIRMCAQATFQEGGAAAFLRGSVPRLCHKIPANGAFFLFYEFFQNALGVDRENRKS